MPKHFEVIDGTPAPDTLTERVRANRRKDHRPPDMLQCPRCGGREVIEARNGATFSGGKLSGGTRTVLCVLCLVRGERVVVR